jgi:hypothetical protein
MNKGTFLWCAIVGLFLSLFTVGIIGFAGTKLPYSPLRAEFTDAASLPALLIVRIFYPEGVHTGGGAPRWGVAFISAAVLFYAVVWLGILACSTRRNRRVTTIQIH